jgi:ABC-type transporter Mla subunit MlaD
VVEEISSTLNILPDQILGFWRNIFPLLSKRLARTEPSSDLDRLVESTSWLSAELTASANDISQNVNRSANLAKVAVTTVEDARVTIGSLNSAAEQIGAIVQLIDEIAANQSPRSKRNRRGRSRR